MKRQKKTYSHVKMIVPIFWKECRFCGREFKWEDGFRIEDYTKINARLYFSYCCTDCCSCISELEDRLRREDISTYRRIEGLTNNHLETKVVNTSEPIGAMHDTTSFYTQLKDCKCGGRPRFNGCTGMRGQIKCSKCDLTIGGMSSSENLKRVWNNKHSK